MPELPDITVYVEHLESRLIGQSIGSARLASPFLLRTYDPPLSVIEHQTVLAVHRLGKQIVLDLTDDLFLVVHLMIAGRLHWRERGARLAAKVGLLALDFPTGSLVLTEASPKKRASLHLIRGRDSMATFDRGGLEVMNATLDEFRVVLQRERHTLKRTLTDPRLFAAIGNAYSDEILHRAGLSPVTLSTSLDDDSIERLYDATRNTLQEWTDRLRAEAGDRFPEQVTAFHPEMAAHGRYRKPCPTCGTAIQRIVHAENESNYCPRCQTGGKLLADRALSKLLKSDWPKTIEDLEQRVAHHRGTEDAQRTKR